MSQAAARTGPCPRPSLGANGGPHQDSGDGNADGNADGNGATQCRILADHDVLRFRKPTSWRTPAHVGGQPLGSFKIDGGAQGVPGGIVPLASRHFKMRVSTTVAGPACLAAGGLYYTWDQPGGPTIRSKASTAA